MAFVNWTYQDIANTGNLFPGWAKIGGVDGVWDAAAKSVQQILTLNPDVGIKFKLLGGSPAVAQLTLICGLQTLQPAGVDFAEIDFAFGVFSKAGTPMQLGVYELGVLKISLGDYYLSNLLAIQVDVAGDVVYKKDGVIVYTSTVAPSAPLYAHLCYRFKSSTVGTKTIDGSTDQIDVIGIPPTAADHLMIMGVH